MAIAAGLVAITLPPALLMAGVLASRDDESAPRRSPSRPDRVALDPGKWDGPDWASLNLLRHVVATEARNAAVAARRCEAGGGAGFRGCAFPALSRAGAAGNFNSRALFALIDEADPPRLCARGVRMLAGASAMLGSASLSTLRHAGGGERWRDVRAGSHWVRGAARIVRRVAASTSWKPACRPDRSGGSA